MISGCESCKYAVYDSVPYGMGSTSYLSGCRLEDKMGEELSEEEIDLIMDLKKQCPYYEEIGY